MSAQHIWVPAEITVQDTMSPKDNRSPCTADGLFAVTPLTVNGKTIGLFQLCDTIAEVRRLGLWEDTGIREALVGRAERSNFIPPALREAYADALLAYYRDSGNKIHQGV